MEEQSIMDSFIIPAPGTRFTYTRHRRQGENRTEVVEQYSGTVVRYYEGSCGDHTVDVVNDAGYPETFWNGSWEGSLHETITIEQD